ncbi:MAG: RHS repeat-associated core domain-containing protein, partial [Candidatus Thorarchaeota archaeon]
VYEKADPNQHSTSHIRNNYLFHGRTYEPEVGLYFYRHRYYLPRLGRFLQTDPMGYEDSLNLYQAFNQNPVNFVDPMGEDYYRSEYYKRLTSNAKPITWEEIDTALTGISEATRWGVQRVVNLGLGLIQSAGHLINSIFIPGYGNRDHYFYYLDLEDPSGHSVSVDSRPSYQKVAGYSGGDMAKLPEHLYEAGKSGIKMLDPTLSSSERKQHAKRFVEGLTDAGVLVWCGYKYYKNYKAISPITEIAATESNIQMMEIPDDAFVHVTTKQGAQDILKSGLDPNYSGYVTKWKYVKDVNNPKEFNTKIYSQSLWKKKTGKFDEGAYILEINPIENPKYFGPFTNRVNGFPQWLFQGKIIDPNRIGLIKIIPGGN